MQKSATNQLVTTTDEEEEDDDDGLAFKDWLLLIVVGAAGAVTVLGTLRKVSGEGENGEVVMLTGDPPLREDLGDVQGDLSMGVA